MSQKIETVIAGKLVDLILVGIDLRRLCLANQMYNITGFQAKARSLKSLYLKNNLDLYMKLIVPLDQIQEIRYAW